MSIKKDKPFVLNDAVLSELRIYACLRMAGVPLELQGGKLLLSAIKLCLFDADYMQCVSKGLYHKLGEMFEIAPACVEKNMREAISKAWNSGLAEFLKRYLINADKKPGNAKFIRQMVIILKVFEQY